MHQILEHPPPHDKMPFRVEEVKDEQDFAEIARVLWAGFNEPYNATTKWFYPVLTTEAAAVDAIEARLVEGWKGQSDIHWLKAFEVDSGKVVGAAQWVVNKEVNGEPGPHPQIDPPWHAPGSEERRFAGMLLTSARGFMKEKVTSPHLGMHLALTICVYVPKNLSYPLPRNAGLTLLFPELSQIAILPESRGQGVGRLLMEWGIEKGDELGLESVLEAVPFAVPFYERVGYGNMASHDPDVSVPSPSEQWKTFSGEDLRVFLMWRPAGHDYCAGKDAFP